MGYIAGSLNVVCYIIVTIKAQEHSAQDRLIDPASRVFQDFKETHHMKPVASLTTSAGKPVEVRETNSFNNSDLFTNTYFLENMKRLINGKIPERAVYPKGTGAYGYFIVTNNITFFTQAKLFERLGKTTPVFARLSSGQMEKGEVDTNPLAIRGLSFKFYTEEGNLDFLSIQTPVYYIRSPVLFPASVHAFSRRNPKTNLKDRTSLFDFIISHPQSLHWLFWAASEFGLPRGFRHMNGFPIHTYEIYNEQGKSFYVRFKFIAQLGYRSFTLQEALNISSIDPDFFTRDLYNSIKLKKFPEWRMEMDVLTPKQAEEAKFNPFDVMSLWPNGQYDIVPIGRIILNKCVHNHFKEVEQSAFNPANLVPGINSPPDTLFKGRVMAYFDSQAHRLGVNYNEIKVNMPVNDLSENIVNAPNYYPNSFNGPLPFMDDAKPTHRITLAEADPVNFKQAWYFYNHILKKENQKKRMIDVLVLEILRVVHPIQQQFIILLSKVDRDLAKWFKESLDNAKMTSSLPAIVKDIIQDEF